MKIGISHVLAVLAWAVLGAVGFLIDGPLDSNRPTEAVFAGGSLALGAFVFWVHGRHQVTALGLFGLGIAVFTGYSGLYWLGRLDAVPDAMVYATAAGYWTLLCVYALAGARRREYRLAQVTDHEATHWGLIAGIAASAIGLLLLGRYAGPATFVALAGIGLLLAALMLHRHARDRVSVRILASAAIIAFVTTQFFSAYGRLMIVAVGLVAVVLGSSLSARRRVKGWALAGIVPVTVLLIRFREDAQRTAGYGEEHVDGLGSATAPLPTFARLIESDLSHANGEPFLASLLFWIPREWWEGKPVGLGSQLTARLDPELVGTGHSMAAQSMGEWFFSWGWLGAIALVPCLALVLWILDRALWRALEEPIADRRRFLWLVAVVFLAAEVPALAWSGSFTYSTRAGVKVGVVLALLVVFGTKASRDRAAERSQHRKSTAALRAI